MRRTRFDRWPCPIARTADLIGDWWTPLILRNACAGQRRFDDFQESLGLSRAVLAQRLHRLVEEGLLEKVPYAERPLRHEYRLTRKGREFWGVLAAMWRWGADWLWEEGAAPPVELFDPESGEAVRPLVVDETTGRPLDLRRVRVRGADSAEGAEPGLDAVPVVPASAVGVATRRSRSVSSPRSARRRVMAATRFRADP